MRPLDITPVVVHEVVAVHAQDAADLHGARSNLVGAPHVELKHLRRFDDRLEAHLDGLAVGADYAWSVCSMTLDRPSAGASFAAAVHALSDPHRDRNLFARLQLLMALGEATPKARRGLLSALGWVEPSQLRGTVAALLRSRADFWQSAGIAACAMHRVDPGLTSSNLFEAPSALVRARAWRAAGELGRRELVSTAAADAASDDDPACQFWSAWSAVLLGDKQTALEVVTNVAATPGPFRARAFQLALQASSPSIAHRWLSSLPRDPANQRWLIRGAGLVGDPVYVPWLIGQMADPKTTRLAGEAFSLMTGLDLAWLDLEVRPPQNFESGPNDDPNDPNVDMDEDDGLPWPDVKKIEAWWHANSNRFQSGTRYFMGQPLNRDNCLRVLKEGFQRQRIAAALYLSLLNPGTPLFEWRAPARRQQRLLAEMN